MNLINDLKTVMNNDASINALITGGIKLGHLPEDYSISSTWIVYDFHMNEQIDTLEDNNAYTIFTIPITVTTSDSVLTDTITNLVIEHLNNIETNNFIDIHLTANSKTIVLSKPKNVYQSQLEFSAIYVG